MDDNAIVRLFSAKIDEALAHIGLSDVPVAQKMQPTQEGVPLDDCVFIELPLTRPYGWAIRENIDQGAIEKVFKAKETRLHETLIQISALISQDINDTSKPTANDVVNIIHAFITHRKTIASLMALKVGMLRVSVVRNPLMLQDEDVFEAIPNFDLTITHYRELSLEVPAADRAKEDIVEGI